MRSDGYPDVMSNQKHEIDEQDGDKRESADEMVCLESKDAFLPRGIWRRDVIGVVFLIVHRGRRLRGTVVRAGLRGAESYSIAERGQGSR